MLDAQRMEGAARSKVVAERYRLRSGQVNAVPACNRRFATVSTVLGQRGPLCQRVLSRIRRLGRQWWGKTTARGHRRDSAAIKEKD